MATGTPLNTADTVHVLSVKPGSPAALAGIRKGDFVTYGASPLARASVIYAERGSRVTVTVNHRRLVTMTAGPTSPTGIPWIVTAIRLAFLLIAAVLAWRRSNDRAARALVCFLWSYGLAISLPNGRLATPLASLIVMQVVPPVLFAAGGAAAAKFASTFPSGDELRVPKLLANLAVLVLIVDAILIVVVNIFSVASSLIEKAVGIWYGVSFAIIILIVVAILTIAYVKGEPSQRQRRRWIFLILGVGIGAILIDVLVQSLVGFQEWLDQLILLPVALIPLGLAYVILRHRVIDVGFVLNRAIVYTGVSAVIVAVFVVVETLMAKYVEQTSHVGSVAVQLAVALVLGFSVRAIHTRVDRFVDSVLFRERHVAEAAIRNFAHDAAYITDAGVLLTRCLKTVERYARAGGAGIWTPQNGAYRAAAGTFLRLPSVDENDPAVLAMRARRVCVDVRESESALPGALAFPMIVRGELLGILVCGPKPDDETYAPDERDALAQLATSVGYALDGIEVRELRRTLAAATSGVAGAL